VAGSDGPARDRHRLGGLRLEGHPTPIRAAVLASVAIGDIDGDGLLDVVAADVEGKVYAWDYRVTGSPASPSR